MNTGIIVVLKNIAPLLLYAAWVFLLLASLSGRVKYGIMFLVALMPLQNIIQKVQAFPLGKDFNDILIICILIGSVVAASRSKHRLAESNSFNTLLLVTLFYTYFTLWNGSFFLGAPLPISPLDERVQNWKNYVVFFFLFWVVFNNARSTKDIRQLFWVMVGSMWLVNYYTMDQIRYSSGLASREKFTGTFVWLGVNETAAFYATYTFVIIGVFLSMKQKIPKIILGLLGAVNTYVVLFLFSRGAYAAYFIGACFFFMFKKRWLLIPLIVVAIAWRTILPTQVIERIEHTKDESGQLDGSSERRIVMWQQSMELFQNSPIIGKGFNIIPYLGFVLGDTHNVYVKILAEQGIVGAILMLMVLILGMRSGLRLFRRARDGFLKGMGLGFAACIVAIFIGNMFGDRWTHTPLGAFFWVFLAMVERGNKIAEGEEKSVNELAGKRVDELKPQEIEQDVKEIQKPRVRIWKIGRGRQLN
jgi:O-antigen ligase